MSHDAPPGTILDYETPRHRSLWSRVMAVRADALLLIATAWILLLGVVGTRMLVGIGDGGPEIISLHILLASGGVFAVARRGESGGRPLQGWNRIACGVPATVCFLGMIRLQTCPHATYLRVGPLLLPIAGRPCNNTQPFELFLPARRLLGGR